MHYRTYGNTGKKVSLLGFGGMRFDRDEEKGAAAMLRAYELGVNFFDTAPFYCRDKSLDIFGRALPLMDREKIIVSSKSNSKADRDEAALRKRVDNMLERMKIDTLDVLHMWCIFDLDQYRTILAPGGPYEGARKLKEEGIVRHVSFSAHAPTSDIVTMCEEGHFDGALLSFNIINHAARIDGLRAARRNNLGVATMNPLGGGLLTRLSGRLRPGRKEADKDLLRTAFRFVASHEEVSLVLSGMKSVEEVEMNVAALEDLSAPRPDLVTGILDRFSDVGQDFCTTCRYCLPCPEEIDIPSFMAAQDLHRAGLHETAKQELRFRVTRNRADACSECGECEEKCTQQLPIVKRLKKTESFFGEKY
jgi:uncharacterized protein